MAAIIVIGLLAAVVTGCGGSANASSKAGSTGAGAGSTAGTSAAGASPSGASATGADGTTSTSGRDACLIVTPDQLKRATGTDFAAGQPETSAIGGSTCDFFATTGPAEGSVVVQVTPQPDVYFPKSLDSQFKDLVPLTATADRGWVTKPDPADNNYGHVLVVKGGVGVDVAILVAKSVTVKSEQGLAAAIAGQM